MGLMAMKPLCGGLLTHARPAFAFLRQYENVVPIWGFQRMAELEELLALDANPPALDDELLAAIERDRRELGGRLLPRLRLLPALPRRDPHPDGGAHGSAAAAHALRSSS